MAASVWSGYLTFGLISMRYGFSPVRVVRAFPSICCTVMTSRASSSSLLSNDKFRLLSVARL